LKKQILIIILLTINLVHAKDNYNQCVEDRDLCLTKEGMYKAKILDLERKLKNATEALSESYTTILDISAELEQCRNEAK